MMSVDFFVVVCFYFFTGSISSPQQNCRDWKTDGDYLSITLHRAG